MNNFGKGVEKVMDESCLECQGRDSSSESVAKYCCLYVVCLSCIIEIWVRLPTMSFCEGLNTYVLFPYCVFDLCKFASNQAKCHFFVLGNKTKQLRLKITRATEVGICIPLKITYENASPGTMQTKCIISMFFGIYFVVCKVAPIKAKSHSW